MRFGKFVALSNASLSIAEGVTQAIIGPNGAGKTTLVNTISGQIKATSGKVSLDGSDITHAPCHDIARKGLIRTSQITSLFGKLSVRDNIEVGFTARQKYRSPYLHRENPLISCAEDVIELVDLGLVSNHRVDNLSHGDQRLLELALALSMEPRVLLLDEPTAGMSPLETHRFIELVNTHLKSRYTIVLIEHDMRVIMGTADRISVLNRGSVIAEGTPAEIMENPFVQEAYLGRPVS
jgi:branched-chain amino acid transport system ATP-binding protein